MSEVSWGNLWHRTDLAGKTTTFEYDTLGRLKKKIADATHPSLAYAHAIARVEYDYDVSGARTAACTYGSTGTLLYSEATPRTVSGAVDHKETASGTLGYQYYINGQLKDVVSSNTDGVNVGYRYDELNRLQYVDDASAGATTRTSAYAYNGNGSLATVTYANGIAHAYGYDTLNRLRTLTVAHLPSTIVHSYTYALRPSGHRRQVLEGGKTTTYDYDELYRLTGETVTGGLEGTNGSVSYALDKVGNRSSRLSSVPSVSSVVNQIHDARDRLTDIDGRSVGYDLNGNTTSGSLQDLLPSATGTFTDVYDFENRLILRRKSDGTQINISYDADGNRVQKTILDGAAQLASATHYLVDTNNLTGYSQVFEERTTTFGSVPSVTTVQTYTYGSDLISCTNFNSAASTSTTRFYAYDGHGSVRELTDEAGLVTETYTYDAFGVLTGTTSTSIQDLNPYRYCGEQWDFDLGLYFNRARYLNPNSGRFWSMDSYEGSSSDPASLHKYLYAEANPVSGIDPTGRYTADFGRAVEREIQTYYTTMFGSSDVTFGRWARGYKPDILDFTRRRWMEIKPLSIDGIRGALEQWVIYSLTFGAVGVVPDFSWAPPTGGRIGRITVVGTPVVVINIGGILFYTDAIENAAELLSVVSIDEYQRLIDWVNKSRSYSKINEMATIRIGFNVASQASIATCATVMAIIPTAMYLSMRGV